MHHGWIIQVLPFMEAGGIANAVDPDVSVYDPINMAVLTARINTLRCPSEPKAGTAGWTAGSSYVGCHHDVEAPIDVDNHGVFFLNSFIRPQDVTDGTSFTIFVGEKRVEPGDLGWSSGTNATLRNTGSPIAGDGPFTPAANDLFVGGFGSHHVDGANFAFGDGSVRHLLRSIDWRVYPLLGHRADGEMIESDGP